MLVETASGGYLTAVDDGTVTTALPRPIDNDPDNMPEPQDIITMVKVYIHTMATLSTHPTLTPNHMSHHQLVARSLCRALLRTFILNHQKGSYIDGD